MAVQKSIYYAKLPTILATLENVFKAEEGYMEKASNKDLDSKTANAGYNNYTKYWRDLNSYGLMGQPSSFAGGGVWYWCAGFITWVFVQVFGLELAKKLLLHLPYTSCANMGTLASKAGRLYSSPQVGDIVLFWNGTRFSHTGYVYKVADGKFFTAEGNTNSGSAVVANGGSVCLKSYSISTYQKKGTKFFRPDYSLAIKAESKIESNTKTTTASSTATVTKVKVNTKTDPLNCRKTAKSNGAIIGSFKKGATLTLVEKTNKTWWKVKGKDMATGKTITGYCSASYLK